MSADKSIWISFLDATPLEQVSFVLTVGGLIASIGVNIWTLFTARRAAQAAEDAKNKIFYLDMMIEFPNAFAKIDALQKLQKSTQWHEINAVYTELRKLLVTIRTYLDAKLSEHHKKSLDEIVTRLAINQSSVRSAMHKQLPAIPKIAALNEALSDLEIQLHEIFIQIKVGN